MLRSFLILVVVALLFWLAADRLLDGSRQVPEEVGMPQAAPQAESDPVLPAPTERPTNLVGDISVHTEEEMDILLDRVERLLDRPRGGGEEPIINLVLHGPEVEFFALKNYERYKGIVDRAAKLAALGAVDISVCQTRMRSLGIAPDQMPSFLRQVPYGPGEVERLIEKGFVYM